MNNFLKSIYIFFFFTIFVNFEIECKSLDSPNLDVEVVQGISWEEWLKNTKIRFIEKKFKGETLNYLDSIKFNSRVIELDRKQPEFRLKFDKYFNNVVTKKNIKRINLYFNNNEKLLRNIENTFNVKSEILVSLWGIETSFGKHLGKLDILSSLATLAYDGRRKDFFSKELENALFILDKGHFNRNIFKGSWAGAFGQTQFMPSTFLKYAVDFDGDSKKNLFNKGDALASGANYLNKIGWDNNIPWGEKVDLLITNELKELAIKREFKDTKFWMKKGLVLKKNYNDNLLKLILPDSNNNQCYLVSKNFDVILDWNRSNYFALTVFLFSDEIK